MRKTMIIASILIGAMLILSGCNLSPGDPGVYSDKRNADELEILKNPVDIDTLEKIVGEVIELTDIGSGRHVYTCTSELFGPLILDLEENDELSSGLEIMKCTVIKEKDASYVLFSKYSGSYMGK